MAAEFRTSEEVLGAIQDYERLQQVAEEQCNFMEADKCASTIRRLKEEYERKCQEEIGDQQKTFESEMLDAHEKELQDHNEEWDNKLREFEAYSEEAQEKLLAKQAEQIESTTQTLDEKIPKKPKPSTEWLNLNRIKASVIKQKNYKEAHYAQQKQLALEQEEQARWDIQRQDKIGTELLKLKKNHEKEMINLEKRLKAGYIELCKKREEIYNQKVRRFNNSVKQLQLAQSLQKNKSMRSSFYSKSQTPKGSISRSRPSSARIDFK